MNSIINYIVLATALLLSSISAFYSVIGLAAIFPGSFWPIVIMGSSLEVAKVVTASWLYRNWKICPTAMKAYMASAVVVLVLITSMGTFGYLSKAHIEQGVIQSSNKHQIESVELKIDLEQKRIKNAQRALDSLNQVVENVNVERATAVRARQVKERQTLETEINTAAQTVITLNEQLLPLKQQRDVAAADLGPIKYVTELLFGAESANYQDKAVRMVIIAIIMVFDPLAVLLIIAANIGFASGLYNYKNLIRNGLRAKI